MHASGTGHTEVADVLETKVGLKMLIHFVTIFYPQALPPPIHVSNSARLN